MSATGIASVYESLLASIGQAGFAEAIRESRWGFAAIEVVHLLAISGLVGGLVVVALGNRREQGEASAVRQPLARVLALWLLVQWLLAVASGFLLFSTDTVGYAGNPAFRTKIVLLVAMSAWTWSSLHSRELPARGWRHRAAWATVAGWCAVELAGRAIGVL